MSRDRERVELELMAGEPEPQSVEDIRACQAKIASRLAGLKLRQQAVLAEYDARQKAQGSQGIFKRIWGGITGGNRQLKAEIDDTYRRAQALERDIEHRREETARLQAQAHRLVHNDIDNEMKSIGAQTAALARVGRRLARPSSTWRGKSRNRAGAWRR